MVRLPVLPSAFCLLPFSIPDKGDKVGLCGHQALKTANEIVFLIEILLQCLYFEGAGFYDDP